MDKKHYGTPTLLWVEYNETDVVRTSLNGKDVIDGDVYGDEVWG